MSKQGCAKTIWGSAWASHHPCSRAGTIEREAKWWCFQHDPDAFNTRREKRQAKWAEENRQSNERYRRLAAERLAVGFLATTALEAGIVKATFTSHGRLADALRAVVQLNAKANDAGTLDALYFKLLPDIKAALAGIPEVTALKEAHDDTA